MKSRDSLIRLKRFQVEDHRRRIAKIELMINEFSRMAAELDREITSEETKSGITDTNHFAYPTYARSARARRDNLKQSTDELRGQLDDVRAKLEIASQDLQKAEALEGRERGEMRGSDQRHIGLSGLIA